MENASKALLMAAGVLIGVLLLTLIATLFISANEFTTGYEEEKRSEAVQRFNVNFTQYVGKKLTIHQVVTICNFAEQKGVTVQNKKNIENLKDDKVIYHLKIIDYSDGFVSKIQIY